MAVLALDEVIDEIMRREAVHGVRIVGVDGPSGSGKTTLARRLAAALGEVTVVAIDDFVSWQDVAGWWPRFDEQVLTPLLAGEDARYQVRDWVGDEYGSGLNGWKTAPWRPVVLFEGVTCTRRETIGRLAYSIWVEAPQPLRLERDIRREGEEKAHLLAGWMRDEAAFFRADGTRERADLRVDGDPQVPHDPVRDVVRLDP
jgi:energy-coupling factor transporter ATP-binding protein EcfA2